MNDSQITEEDYRMYASFGMTDMVHADISAGAESAFLSAVLSVTDVNPIHVGFTTGYGENDNVQIKELLNTNAYTIHEFSLVTEEITPEIDFIIIDSPDADYSADSLSKLAEWLDNDGKFGKTLIYIAHFSAVTPRIDGFMEEWGISVDRAYAIQTDMRFTAQMGMIQYYDPHDFEKGLNPDYRIYGEFMRHVSRVFEAQWNMETTPILSTYGGAVLLPFDQIDDTGTGQISPDWDIETAEQDAYTVGVMSSKVRFEDNTGDAFSSNVVALGGSNILDPNFLAMQNSNNAEYFINIMNSISGKDDVVTIAPKSFAIAAFQISESGSRWIGLVFAAFLPFAVITTGVVIWIRRIRS
jgi:hypothetical protein